MIVERRGKFASPCSLQVFGGFEHLTDEAWVGGVNDQPAFLPYLV